jgi:hypothetical protein
MDCNEYNCPIQWLKKNEDQREELAAIAKQYLTIKASSVSSARILARSID